MPRIENYLSVADSQVFEDSVQLSSLAIGSSVEDLSFLESRFKAANWTLGRILVQILAQRGE